MNFDRVGRYWPETLSIVRIVVGLLFLEHGSAKLLGFPGTPNPAPAMMTLLWTQGVIELVGGLLLAIGLFTRPVAFILAGDMAVVYFMAHAPKNFFRCSMAVMLRCFTVSSCCYFSLLAPVVGVLTAQIRPGATLDKLLQNFSNMAGMTGDQFRGLKVGT